MEHHGNNSEIYVGPAQSTNTAAGNKHILKIQFFLNPQFETEEIRQNIYLEEDRGFALAYSVICLVTNCDRIQNIVKCDFSTIIVGDQGSWLIFIQV